MVLIKGYFTCPCGNGILNFLANKTTNKQRLGYKETGASQPRGAGSTAAGALTSSKTALVTSPHRRVSLLRDSKCAGLHGEKCMQLTR